MNSLFTRCFLYDWYDGPTAGVALDRAGEPVYFQNIAWETGSRTLLVVRVSSRAYSALEARYGPPPDSVFQGLVVEWDDRSAAVADPLAEAAAATEGIVVTCEYDGEGRILLQRPASKAELEELRLCGIQTNADGG